MGSYISSRLTPKFVNDYIKDKLFGKHSFSIVFL